MKRRWSAFLLKLFLPGLLALPWLLNLKFRFLPEAHYEGGDWYDPWSTVIAYGGLVCAVVAPLILLEQKPMKQRLFLIPLWILFLALLPTAFWVPLQAALGSYAFTLAPILILCVSILLLFFYIRFYRYAKLHKVPALRLHTSLVLLNIILLMVIAEMNVAGTRILFFLGAPDDLDLNTYFDIVQSLIIATMIICLLTVITHYAASIRHFRKQHVAEDALIDEIGRS
jgi:hypothetical protein